MSKKNTIIKRVYKDKKTGKIKKVYYYEVSKTSEGKKKYTRTVGAKKREVLTDDQLDARLALIDNESLKRSIKNRVNEILVSGKGITRERLDEMIKDQRRSKEEQFMRNLGYSPEEFAQQFKLSEEDLISGQFKELGSQRIQFTSQTGKTFIFSWDYDGGAILES